MDKGVLIDGSGRRLFLLTKAQLSEIIFIAFAVLCLVMGFAFMFLEYPQAKVLFISSAGYVLCAIAARFAGGFKNG